jgi:hypothetical protein
VNFSIPPYRKPFSYLSTPFPDINFCRRIPNSTRNKNVKRLILYLVKKMVFLASKTLLYLSGRGKKNISFNFERYDLANGKE